jgi:hypothetical protein
MTKNEPNKTNDQQQTKQTNQQRPNDPTKETTNLSRWIIIPVDAIIFFEKRKQQGDPAHTEQPTQNNQISKQLKNNNKSLN